MDALPGEPLLPGERLRWSGRPGSGLLFVASDLFVVPFTFVWCGMATIIFWQGGRAFVDQPFSFVLIPFLFVGVGLFMAVGRFVLAIWLRARTRYAITDWRVLITRAPPFGRTTTLMLRQLPDIRFKPGRGGRGTIAFGNASSVFGHRGFGSAVPSLDPTPQLLAIDAAADVHALLQRLVADAAR